jgi:VanZ family protein
LIYHSLALQTHFRVFSTNALLSSFLLTILYGVTDEFHQSFVPGRHASLLDLVADSFGALLFAPWVFVRRTERNGGR